MTIGKNATVVLVMNGKPNRPMAAPRGDSHAGVTGQTPKIEDGSVRTLRGAERRFDAAGKRLGANTHLPWLLVPACARPGVALARKLAVVLHRMVANGRTFWPTKRQRR